MKKIVLSASLLALSLFAKAQDASSDYKPVQGDVTTEFSYGGLFNTSQLSLNNGNLKFRYFLADNLAGRIGVNISSNSTTNRFFDADDEEFGTQKATTSGFGLNLGVEKHFSGSDRLSTYAGADLLLQLDSESEKWNDYNGSDYSKGSTGTVKGGSTGFGLRLITGAEYYIVKKVYLGGELGWGFLYRSARDTKMEYKDGSFSVDETTPAEENAKTFNLSPSVVGAIRLGFRF